MPGRKHPTFVAVCLVCAEATFGCLSSSSIQYHWTSPELDHFRPAMNVVALMSAATEYFLFQDGHGAFTVCATACVFGGLSTLCAMLKNQLQLAYTLICCS